MRKLFFVLLFVAFFLQFSILAMIIPQAHINLVFLVVVVFSIIYSFEENVLFILLGGFLIDIFSYAGFGLNLIGFLTTAFAVDALRRTILPERRGTIIPAIIFMISKLIFDILLWLVSYGFYSYRLSTVTFSLFGGNVLGYLLDCGIYIIIGVIVYKLVNRWDSLFGRARSELKLSNR